MKLNCTKENLDYALHLIQYFSPTRSPLPIISGALLKTKNNGLSLTTSDLEASIQTLIPAYIHEEGSAVLPTRQLSEIVHRLPNTDLEIEKESQSNSLKIKYGSSEVILHGFEVEDFPVFPHFEGGIYFEVTMSNLKEIIKKVVYAKGTDESRSVFTGVLFEIEGASLNLVATDAHRIAVYKLIGEEVDFTKKEIESRQNRFIVPGKVLNNLSRIILSNEQKIKIAINDKQVLFLTDEICLISRLIEGDFPDYRRVIPREFKTKVKIKVKDILGAVDRASLLTKKENNMIKLGISSVTDFESDSNRDGYATNSTPGLVTVFVDDEVGKIYEEMECNLLGERMEIGFNVHYLNDVLRLIDTSKVVVELTGPLSPAVIRPDNEDSYEGLENLQRSRDIDEKINYLSILLPVRIY